MKLFFDSLTTLKVIHAENPIVIFFGTYGITIFRWINKPRGIQFWDFRIYYQDIYD